MINISLLMLSSSNDEQLWTNLRKTDFYVQSDETRRKSVTDSGYAYVTQ